MIKKLADMRHESRENMRGGNGTVTMVHFLEPDEARQKGRLFAIATFPPGASIGEHPHQGEFEIYQILKGTATVADNGETATLSAGDCMVCYDGNRHSIANDTDEELEVLFTVIFDK